jgi:hypothetical protein
LHDGWACAPAVICSSKRLGREGADLLGRHGNGRQRRIGHVQREDIIERHDAHLIRHRDPPLPQLAQQRDHLVVRIADDRRRQRPVIQQAWHGLVMAVADEADADLFVRAAVESIGEPAQCARAGCSDAGCRRSRTSRSGGDPRSLR